MPTEVMLRQNQPLTLTDLADQITTTGELSQDVATSEIRLNLTDSDPSIVVGDREVPATQRGIQALGSWLAVPEAFLKRLHNQVGPDVSQDLLTALLERTSGSAASITFGDGGITEVRDPGQRPIPPSRIVHVATRVLGNGDSLVQRLVDEPGEFSFDVHVPFDAQYGVGGDGETVEVPEAFQNLTWATGQMVGERQVGDLTAGGLRFGQDRKRNLAPWVQPWMMRLACTNGMETTDEGLRIDARGLSVDSVLAELEAAAERAFSRVEDQIRHFYDLRNTPIPEDSNPERVIRRIGRERGIPPRSVNRLLDLAPSRMLPSDPSMFDVVNLITNLANSTDLRRDGGRLILERAGGAEVADHAIRCDHCNSRMG